MSSHTAPSFGLNGISKRGKEWGSQLPLSIDELREVDAMPRWLSQRMACSYTKQDEFAADMFIEISTQQIKARKLARLGT